MTHVKPKPTATRERPRTGWGGPLSRALADDAARRRPNKVTLPSLKFLAADDPGDEPTAIGIERPPRSKVT